MKKYSNISSQHLRFYGAYKDKVYTGPQDLYLDITTICNLRCLYCWDHSPFLANEIPPYELSFDAIKSIIDDAKELGVEKVHISGDGEPTLHKDFNGIIDYIYSKRMAMDLTSNGLISKKVFSSLLKMSAIEISISPAGSQMSKNNLLAEVAKNIRKLQKIKSNNPAIVLVYILTNKNLTEIPKIIEFAEKLNIFYTEFVFMDAVKETKKLQLKDSGLKEFAGIVKKPC